MLEKLVMTKFRRHGKLPEVNFPEKLEARFIAMTRNKCVRKFKIPFTKYSVRIYKRVLTRAAKNLNAIMNLKEVGEIYGVRFVTSNKKTK